VPADDLSVLQSRIQASARVDANGEVSWPVNHAPEVIETLAENGRLVLGLDLRRYDDDGSFYEYAWSSFDGQNVMAARDAALLALRRDDLPGDWVLITW
jgi:hypothetical protein